MNVLVGTFRFKGGLSQEERDALVALLRSQGMPVVAVESVHINRGAISYMERVLLVMEEDAEHPGQPLLDDIFQLVFQWSKIRRLHFEGRS